MGKINKIEIDLNNLKTDVQVSNYWESNYDKILKGLNTIDSNFETITTIFHKLAKSLNNREKYSSIHYLYKTGYLPIENKLPESDSLNELKFELGRGLHHKREYDYSKKLFNELATTDFDISRIDGWMNQTVIASTRE